MKTIAVILAAGESKRLGKELPKQFLSFKGKTLILYSIEAFEKNRLIDEIILVVPKNYLTLSKKTISQNSFKKITAVISGGNKRYESSWNALNHIHTNENCKILIHDAARPYIKQELINLIISSLNKYDAVCPGIRVTDTILKVYNNFFIEDIPNRKHLYRAQTPQGFKLNTIKIAFTKWKKNKNFEPTDDCSIVKKYLPNVDICMVNGDVKNKKITFEDDF